MDVYFQIKDRNGEFGSIKVPDAASFEAAYDRAADLLDETAVAEGALRRPFCLEEFHPSDEERAEEER